MRVTISHTVCYNKNVEGILPLTLLQEAVRSLTQSQEHVSYQLKEIVMSKYGHRQHHWFEAVVNKVGGEERAESLLRGELQVVESNVERVPIPWCLDIDDTIRIAFTTNGQIEKNWAGRLERSDISVMNESVRALGSNEFIRSPHMHHEVVILRAASYKQQLNTKQVLSIGEKMRLSRPHHDIACFTIEKLHGIDLVAMGLDSVIFMHAPLMIDGHRSLFAISRPLQAKGSRCVLGMCTGEPDQEWHSRRGFAFMIEWP